MLIIEDVFNDGVYLFAGGIGTALAVMHQPQAPRMEYLPPSG